MFYVFMKYLIDRNIHHSELPDIWRAYLTIEKSPELHSNTKILERRYLNEDDE